MTTERDRIERRLKSWRKVVETGLPREYAADAPRIVALLEAELGATFGPDPVISLTDYERRIAEELSHDD